MLIGMGPSPMLYFATHYLDVDGGIQVTGSHNPADYNGFKLLLKGRSVFGQEIQAHRPARGRRATGAKATERIEEVDIREAYVDRLLEGFSGKPFRIGWDAGNGAAGPILDMLVDRLPGQHHAIFTDVDGTFPNHHPDPTVEKNLDRSEAPRRRQAARLRHRLRRRRRPHRRGRRQGPRDLGRPAADDPRRAGAEGAARRDDHRRREGEPGACSTASPNSAASR